LLDGQGAALLGGRRVAPDQLADEVRRLLLGEVEEV
jgi:hypothetical protein